MDLSGIRSQIEKLDQIERILKTVGATPGRAAIDVLDAAKPAVLAAIARRWPEPVLIITALPERAKQLVEDLRVWCGANAEVILFPEPDALPYERIASDPSTVQQRLAVLLNLHLFQQGRDRKRQTPPIIVAPAHAVMMKTVTPGEVKAGTYLLRRGSQADPLKLAAQWVALGYEPVATVEEPGQFSRRGGIADIFPPTSDYPVRLEFFGDEIDSLRLFDPASQRSVRLVEEVRYSLARETPPHPASEEVHETARLFGIGEAESETSTMLSFELRDLLDLARNQGSLFAHFPPETMVLVDEPSKFRLEVEQLEQQSAELRQGQIQRGQLREEFPIPYWTAAEIAGDLAKTRHLVEVSYRLEDEDDASEPKLDLHMVGAYSGRLRPLIRDIQRWSRESRTVIVTSQQSSRLAELLADADTFVEPKDTIDQPPPQGALILVHGSLPEGFAVSFANTSSPWSDQQPKVSRPAAESDEVGRAKRATNRPAWPWTDSDIAEAETAPFPPTPAPGDLIILTDREIFGFLKPRRTVKRRPVSRDAFLAGLAPGDYVVHIEHGIGRFTGMSKMSIDGLEREYLTLNYAEGDRLYVPVDQLDRVNRYVGSGEHIPALTRLGTQEWVRAKERARRSVHEIAKELLTLYATRELAAGFAFSPDNIWQHELEASFPFIETADQLEAIQAVKEDMQAPKPMDRLICGDVGYGKTEIAVRAAFKAVLDGKQVAVLVPTTVLAQQHFATFRERVGAFPVRVEVLSRFRSEKEQQAVLRGLREGTVDICIGTHRLIQKDVEFKNLGLLIVDEEQRFGVVHKEHLKNLRKEVDVLTLTATPIPRTLHMSLVGVRDMSTMETPPEERLPIKTFVTGYDDRIVREAFLREMDRGGQVFFVHNRVHNIAHVANHLMELVPEASIVVGHGQMPEDQLERVMLEFVNGQADVLICTTIIESGLDIPNVNTIIINHADRFGLAQLYQLRGRVGRGANRAYAYFLYNKDHRLTETAEKRLRTIFEATELGAGFRIAMKDLEIRGAGNLLGSEQSGHISAVGFDLYCRMLAETVAGMKALQAGKPAIKQNLVERKTEVAVDLPLSAFLPAEYIADDAARLAIYQRLATLATVDELEEIAQEMRDRFGEAPTQAKDLLYIVEVKLRAAKAGVTAVRPPGEEFGDKEIVVVMGDLPSFDRSDLLRTFPRGVQASGKQLRISLERLGTRWTTTLTSVLQYLAEPRTRRE